MTEKRVLTPQEILERFNELILIDSIFLTKDAIRIDVKGPGLCYTWFTLGQLNFTYSEEGEFKLQSWRSITKADAIKSLQADAPIQVKNPSTGSVAQLLGWEYELDAPILSYGPNQAVFVDSRIVWRILD